MKKGLLAVVMALALAGAIWILRDLQRPFCGYSGSSVVVVEPGAQAPAVARLLVSRGVLRHRLPFLLLYGLERTRHRTIKAGEYLFDRPSSPLDVYWKLAQGDVYTRLVTVPEGSDRFDMARIFEQRLDIDPKEFLALTEQASTVRDLDPVATTLEGYLFPDTYRFPYGASPSQVVLTMLARFRQVLASKLPQDVSEAPGRLHDLMTLASLVEKETPDPSERPLIAGVFARRLEKGMLLECDPSVVYAGRLNHKLSASALRPLTQNDLDINSPYNTYRYPGLPPGPICSPGEVSLRAALRPTAGDSLYFVSNNRGGHIFASTLAQHHHNVARYRKEVAALHGAALNQENVAEQPPPYLGQKDGGRIDATKRSTRGARHKEQKGSHPGVLPGARSGTG